MMGRTHALTGPVVALATLPLVNMVLPTPITGYGIIVVAVCAAGGAMVPDFDHASSSISVSMGPPTRALGAFIGVISGGHRNGTHSILGILGFSLWTWLAAHPWHLASAGPLKQFTWMSSIDAAQPYIYGMWLAFLFAVASMAMRMNVEKAPWKHIAICLAIGALIGWGAASLVIPPVAATVGVGLGCLAHIIGDMATKEGCPLLWPFWRYRVHYASFTTGKEAPWEAFVRLCCHIAIPMLTFFYLWYTGVLPLLPSPESTRVSLHGPGTTEMPDWFTKGRDKWFG